MSEENKENLENTAEEENTAAVTGEDTAEENTSEEVTENVEPAEADEATAPNVVDEAAEAKAAVDGMDMAADDIEGADEISAEEVSDGIEAAPVEKKKNTGLIVGIIIAAVVVVAIVVLGIVFGKNLFNKYNRMGYVDVSGRTIAEIADESGYELADFLALYGLPADMPGSTSESAAYYNIPCSVIAEMYGMDFVSMKELLQWGDEITEDTTWGEAEGETTLSAYIGDDNLAAFKEQYGLGDEVTGETKWKEIRNIIDQQSRDARIAEEKAVEEAANATEEPAEDTAEESSAATEAPAEGDAATEATEAPAA